MLLNILKQFNWLDIFILILFLRICYIAVKNGLPAEFFKLLGTVLAIYLSFHYYTNLADIIRERISAKNIPLEFLDFLCFLILAIAGYLIVTLLRETFFRLIKLEAVQRLNKWGALVLGIGRGFLLSSLIVFALFISTISYFENSVNDSYLGQRLFKVAPAVYSQIWEAAGSKFMAKEGLNKTIEEVEKDFKPR